MGKLISVEALKDWLGHWFRIDLDELYDIVERMPDEGKAKTNFEWLVEEKELKTFLTQLYWASSRKEICDKWGIETPPEGVCRDLIEIIADWLTAPHVDKDVFDEEEIHENCTVQILRNSATGEVSVGWWKNGKTNC